MGGLDGQFRNEWTWLFQQEMRIQDGEGFPQQESCDRGTEREQDREQGWLWREAGRRGDSHRCRRAETQRERIVVVNLGG